jgi:hypothetical protein
MERQLISNGRKSNMNEQRKPVGLVVLMPTRGAISVETFECLRIIFTAAHRKGRIPQGRR